MGMEIGTEGAMKMDQLAWEETTREEFSHAVECRSRHLRRALHPPEWDPTRCMELEANLI